MKLTDIAPKTDVRLITKVMKSYFKPKVDVSGISESAARSMLDKTRALIKEAKNTTKLHTSEKSPAYLQLLMLEQALKARIAEAGADSPSYANGTAYKSAVANAIAPGIQQDEEEEDDMEEGNPFGPRQRGRKVGYYPKPKKKIDDEDQVDEIAPIIGGVARGAGAVGKALAKGIKKVGQAAGVGTAVGAGVGAGVGTGQAVGSAVKKKLTQGQHAKEASCGSKRKKMGESIVNESEVETAQVVLAAQDMVDKISGWMEDVADMQYKDLPSLVEMMRNEVGVNEAQAYLDSMTSTLGALLSAMEQSKADATSAMSPMTGEQSIDPSEFGDETPAEPDLGGDDEDIPGLDDPEPEETELEPDLGRERR